MILAAQEQHQVARDLRARAITLIVDPDKRAVTVADIDKLKDASERLTRHRSLEDDDQRAADEYLMWFVTGLNIRVLQDILNGLTPMKHHHAIDFQLAHRAMSENRRRRTELPLTRELPATPEWRGDPHVTFDAGLSLAVLRRDYHHSHAGWTTRLGVPPAL